MCVPLTYCLVFVFNLKLCNGTWLCVCDCVKVYVLRRDCGWWDERKKLHTNEHQWNCVCLCVWNNFDKNVGHAPREDRTLDPWFTRPVLYHWAMEATCHTMCNNYFISTLSHTSNTHTPPFIHTSLLTYAHTMIVTNTIDHLLTSVTFFATSAFIKIHRYRNLHSHFCQPCVSRAMRHTCTIAGSNRIKVIKRPFIRSQHVVWCITFIGIIRL